jgi:hypothetical protein
MIEHGNYYRHTWKKTFGSAPTSYLNATFLMLIYLDQLSYTQNPILSELICLPHAELIFVS